MSRPTKRRQKAEKNSLPVKEGHSFVLLLPKIFSDRSAGSLLPSVQTVVRPFLCVELPYFTLGSSSLAMSSFSWSVFSCIGFIISSIVLCNKPRSIQAFCKRYRFVRSASCPFFFDIRRAISLRLLLALLAVPSWRIFACTFRRAALE